MSISINNFNSIYNKEKVINILFALIPLSFICGNSFINLNILLLILSAFFFYKKEIFKIDFSLFDKLIFLFFLILLLSGLFNSLYFYYPEKSIYSEEVLLKSFLYLRFILIYFIIRFLLYKEILNLKLFFIFASICSLFVSIDVLLQFSTGTDIFGYESLGRRNPGPFGDEAISGSYLQRFAFFTLFLFPVFFSNYNKNAHLFFAVPIYALTFSAILFSGNKIPFLMFLLLTVIFIMMNFKSKKIIFFIILLSISIFLAFFKHNLDIRYNFGGFYKKFTQVEIYSKDFLKNLNNLREIMPPNTHIKELHNGLLSFVFDSKKIFGGGIKSYKISCPKFSKYVCSNHPHNYHIEILVSVGILGYLVLINLLLKFLILLKSSYVNKSKRDQMVFLLFSTLFLIEFFPLRTTGSFFSTANATYFFIMMAITISLTQKKNSFIK